MPIPGTNTPWPWESGDGGDQTPDPSQPIGGGGAPPAAATTTAPAQDPNQQATLAYLIGKYGPPIGQPAPNQIKDINGIPRPDPSGAMVYTFGDNTTAIVGGKGELGPVTPGKKPTDTAAPITTNTTDPYIVMRDPTTNQTTTIPNPNYKAQPTSVAANATDQFVVTRNADGSYSQAPNPNYRPPLPTTVATNTTDPFIVTRDASGNTSTQPNPNYNKPAAAPISTNTTDPFIVMRDPVSGATQSVPNPNYNKPAAAPIAANTTDPFIVMRDPTTGTTQSVPNPNYQKPAAAVVGSPGTNDQFIMTRDPTSGAITPQPNPNYVPPRPTVVPGSTATPYITTQDPKTGALVSQPNPSYTPTDPGRMTAQLQQQATAQRDALNQQVLQGKLSPDAAASQFDRWWNDTVEPMKPEIATAQAAAQQAVALSQAQSGLYQAQAANVPASLALTASDYAQKNALALMPYVSGQGFGQAASTIAGGGKLSPQQMIQASTFSLPNLQEIGRLGAAQALANFSPTAQAHLASAGPPAQAPVQGLPNPMDLLNRNAYSFGAQPGAAGAQPMPNPAGGPAPAMQPMPNTAASPDDWLAALMARQQQDVALQRQQALVGMPTAPGQPGTYGPLTASSVPWGTYTPGGM